MAGRVSGADKRGHPRRRFVPAILALATLVLAGCATADRTEGTAVPGGPVVAFYGDSYTRGTGASAPEKRWSSIICAERGWDEVNPSVDGLGFVNNREFLAHDLVDTIVDAGPDIVIVTMGLNDNFSMPDRADEIREAIDGDLGRLATQTDARIVVVEPFWYTDERPSSVGEIIGWVKAGAERIDADHIDGASHWIEGHEEWMASDGIHPNDEGYAAIAERMDAALADLGL